MRSSAHGLAIAIAASMGMSGDPFVIRDRMARRRSAPQHLGKRDYGPTGHRAKGYKKTTHDIIRIEMAKRRRIGRAAKRLADYEKCLANNPCLKAGAE